jgi:hypothetical protein
LAGAWKGLAELPGFVRCSPNLPQDFPKEEVRGIDEREVALQLARLVPDGFELDPHRMAARRTGDLRSRDAEQSASTPRAPTSA